MAQTSTAPAVVRASSLLDSIKAHPLTCSIGAEVSGVHLGAASRDPAAMEELRGLLVKHRVLFFRDQDITRAEHVANLSLSLSLGIRRGGGPPVVEGGGGSLRRRPRRRP